MTIDAHVCQPPACLRVFGEDALDYLQSQLSVDLNSLCGKRVRYALRLDVRGKTLAGMYLIGEKPDSFLLVSRGTDGSDLVELIRENVIADEVEHLDLSMDYKLVTVSSHFADLAFSLFSLQTPEPGNWTHHEGSFCFLDPRLGPSTFTMLLPLETFESQRKSLRLVDWDAFEKQRIQSGLVAVPSEIGPEDLPQEGGLEEECVDFQKGCYLGQEVMARIHAMGKVRRTVRAVGFSSKLPPKLPSPLYLGEKKVGSLRSCMQANHKFIGIALIHENAIQKFDEGSLEIADLREKIHPL